MFTSMSRAAYEQLPRRADLKRDPLPGVYYRDAAGGIVTPVFPDPHNWGRYTWWAFAVTIEQIDHGD